MTDKKILDILLEKASITEFSWHKKKYGKTTSEQAYYYVKGIYDNIDTPKQKKEGISIEKAYDQKVLQAERDIKREGLKKTLETMPYLEKLKLLQEFPNPEDLFKWDKEKKQMVAIEGKRGRSIYPDYLDLYNALINSIEPPEGYNDWKSKTQQKINADIQNDPLLKELVPNFESLPAPLRFNIAQSYANIRIGHVNPDATIPVLLDPLLAIGKGKLSTAMAYYDITRQQIVFSRELIATQDTNYFFATAFEEAEHASQFQLIQWGKQHAENENLSEEEKTKLYAAALLEESRNKYLFNKDIFWNNRQYFSDYSRDGLQEEILRDITVQTDFGYRNNFIEKNAKNAADENLEFFTTFKATSKLTDQISSSTAQQCQETLEGQAYLADHIEYAVFFKTLGSINIFKEFIGKSTREDRLQFLKDHFIEYGELGSEDLELLELDMKVYGEIYDKCSSMEGLTIAEKMEKASEYILMNVENEPKIEGLNEENQDIFRSITAVFSQISSDVLKSDIILRNGSVITNSWDLQTLKDMARLDQKTQVFWNAKEKLDDEIDYLTYRNESHHFYYVSFFPDRIEEALGDKSSKILTQEQTEALQAFAEKVRNVSPELSQEYIDNLKELQGDFQKFYDSLSEEQKTKLKDVDKRGFPTKLGRTINDFAKDIEPTIKYSEDQLRFVQRYINRFEEVSTELIEILRKTVENWSNTQSLQETLQNNASPEQDSQGQIDPSMLRIREGLFNNR